MLFDKIGRKFYSSDEGIRTTIYDKSKTYLNTAVVPPLFTQFPPFNNLVLTPYIGMARSGESGRTPGNPGIMH